MSQHHANRPDWRKAKTRYRPYIAATLPAQCLGPCVMGGTVYPSDTWHMGDRTPLHLQDPAHVWSADDFAAIHAKCNVKDGARMGAAITNAKKAGEDKRLFTWMTD